MLNWLKRTLTVSPDVSQNASAMPADGADRSTASKKQADQYFSNGRLDDAAQAYRQAIAINPDFAEAYNNLGNVLREQGQRDEAEQCFRQAIRIKPELANAYCNLGALLLESGRLPESIAHFRKALVLNTNAAFIYTELCQALFQAGQFSEAQQVAMQGLVINPKSAVLHVFIGNLHYQLQRFDDAIHNYRKALQCQPDMPEANLNLGKVLHEQGNLPAALDSFDQVLKINPQHASALCDKATILTELRKPLEALPLYDQALALDPDNATIWNNRGNALSMLNRNTEALDNYAQAIHLKADYADAWCNRGLVLCAEKQFQLALTHYQQALSIQPDHAESHFANGFCHLLTGNFSQGWPEYEWRFYTRANKGSLRKLTQPRWSGEFPIAGKTILLHSEQGLGDTLQFVRYASMVAELGAKVLLEVQPPLESLLKNIPGVLLVIGKGQALPHFDCHCPLLSLPYAFKTELRNIPANVPYIFSNAERAAQFKKLLENIPHPRIGIVWSGNAHQANDHNRSIPITEILPLISDAYSFVSLQQEIRPSEQLQSGNKISFFGYALKDFSDTAALIENVDLVISVCTSVAHLAGAMNKPTWVLLPYNADWRWFIDRTDSPWYPSVRLFRQTQAEVWNPLITQVKHELTQFLKNDQSA